MTWYFKDSKGIQGPLTESQIRELLNSRRLDSTSMVRQGESKWVAAENVRTKFARLDQDGVYLRDENRIFGPFTQKRAAELHSKEPNRFDSYKIGASGEWLSTKKTVASQNYATHQTPPVPPPIAPPRQVPQPVTQFANAPTVSSVVARDRLIKRTGKKKAGARNVVALGCGGCLVLPCALAVSVAILGMIFEATGPSVAISGTTGTINVTLYTPQKLEYAASTVLEAVYKAATKNESLTTIIVNVEMSSMNVTDKYGKSLDNDIKMGTITISNLDDVRKYADALAYGWNVNSVHHASVEMRLRTMEGASLLK